MAFSVKNTFLEICEHTDVTPPTFLSVPVPQHLECDDDESTPEMMRKTVDVGNSVLIVHNTFLEFQKSCKDAVQFLSAPCPRQLDICEDVCLPSSTPCHCHESRISDTESVADSSEQDSDTSFLTRQMNQSRRCDTESWADISEQDSATLFLTRQMNYASIQAHCSPEVAPQMENLKCAPVLFHHSTTTEPMSLAATRAAVEEMVLEHLGNEPNGTMTLATLGNRVPRHLLSSLKHHGIRFTKYVRGMKSLHVTETTAALQQCAGQVRPAVPRAHLRRGEFMQIMRMQQATEAQLQEVVQVVECVRELLQRSERDSESPCALGNKLSPRCRSFLSIHRLRLIELLNEFPSVFAQVSTHVSGTPHVRLSDASICLRSLVARYVAC
jgi:hypothetical protein